MIVTNLKSQVKDPERVSVYVDGNFWCGLTVSQIVELGVKKGMSLTESEANNIKKQSEMGKMLARAIDWLMRRPRSRKELSDYLRKKQYAEDESAYITDRLDRYLDDDSFTRFWVDGRRNNKLKSGKEIAFELTRKGVNKEIIKGALEDHGTSDKEVLRLLIDKKRLTTKYPDRNKLIAYLARKGFKYSDIQDAIVEGES